MAKYLRLLADEMEDPGSPWAEIPDLKEVLAGTLPVVHVFL